MNKSNFNSIDKIKTPDKWKSKALNIPQTHIKKPEGKHYNFYRIAACFCLTIVCLISILLFNNMGKIPQPNTIISQKQNNTTVTHNETHNKLSSDSNKEQSTEPYNQSSTTTTQITLEPSENSEATTPTQNQPKETTNTSTTKPTTKPTSAPTIPTQEKPSNETPTQKPTDAPKNVVFSGSVKVENAWGVNDVDVYCKIYDSDGNLLGNQDLFDFQHEAVFESEYNNVEYYSYYASEKGLTFTQGYYTYVFYKRNGTVVCSGTQYVS